MTVWYYQLLIMDHRCGEPNEFPCISSVLYRASRYFMGLGNYAFNAALIGDMGWHHPSIISGLVLAVNGVGWSI